MCPSGATCLPVVRLQHKNPTQRVGLVQIGYHYHLIACSRHDIAEELLTWR